MQDSVSKSELEMSQNKCDYTKTYDATLTLSEEHHLLLEDHNNLAIHFPLFYCGAHGDQDEQKSTTLLMTTGGTKGDLLAKQYPLSLAQGRNATARRILYGTQMVERGDPCIQVFCTQRIIHTTLYCCTTQPNE